MRPLHVAVLSLEHPATACARLRLLDPLSAAGERARVAWHAGPAAAQSALERGALAAADLIVVQRFFPHARTAALLERVLAGAVPVIYETDDLLTDLPATNPHVALARECTPWIEQTMRAARAVTVSTPELARAAAPLARELHVLPNLVDLRQFPFRERNGAPLTVGYSGTPTHVADLERIEPALWRVAERLGSRVRFWFQGCITPGLARLPGAVHVAMQPDYAAYARLLAGSPLDLAIAPLVDNRFNRAKSAIKWLEYAACGIPGVFAALPPYLGAVRDGVTGLLAPDDASAWCEAICELLGDSRRRLEMARAARRAVEDLHALERGAASFASTWERIAQQGRAGARPRSETESEGQVRRAGSRPRSEAKPSEGIRQRVSIVIPVCGRLELTRQCVAELLAHTLSSEVELIVVDNASPDATAAYLASLGARVRVISNASNLGFAPACNQGARAARGEHLLFLNNDTIPKQGWLEPLVRELDDPGVAIAGARLLYPDGKLQHAGIAFSRPDGVPYHVYRGAHPQHPATLRRRELRAVTAACMLVRRSAFEAAGGFDEGYRNGFEDIDLCLRVGGAGGRVVYQPASCLIHLEEQTPGRKAHDGPNLRRFLERWSARIAPDETRVLLEDGCAVSGAGSARVIAPLRDAAERSAWQRVADAERALEQGGRGLPPDLAGWPDDPATRAWGAGLRARSAPPNRERDVERMRRVALDVLGRLV